jgi:uncharacterized protein YndB with AHSA1/START domain
MATASTTAVVDVDQDALFSTLTDLDRLPEWNTAITRVLDRPEVLEPGAEWVVEMSALAQHWPSRSRVEAIDAHDRRFSYRACTDDGNPSYALWSWTVAADPGGSRVTVTWDLHPKTFWRRVLLARIRARQLARTEVPTSLAALATAARRTASISTKHDH